MRNRDARPGPDTPYRRRRLLRTGTGLASLAAIGALSGYQDAPVIGDESEAAVVDTVPAASQVLFHAEVGSILENEELRESVPTLLTDGEVPAAAASISELLDKADDEFGHDPRQAEILTFFGPIPEAVGDRVWAADDPVEVVVGPAT